MRRAAVLENEDTLPRSQREPPVHHRHDLAGPREHHPQVGGRIIGTFGGVNVMALVLGHEPLEERVQIGPRAGVGVFVDDEARAGVLHEHGRRAGGDAARAHHAGHVVGDFVRALAPGVDRERFCVCFHGAYFVIIPSPNRNVSLNRSLLFTVFFALAASSAGAADLTEPPWEASPAVIQRQMASERGVVVVKDSAGHLSYQGGAFAGQPVQSWRYTLPFAGHPAQLAMRFAASDQRFPPSTGCSPRPRLA